MPVTINGNGSITGLAQGGIDGTKVVTAASQAKNNMHWLNNHIKVKKELTTSPCTGAECYQEVTGLSQAITLFASNKVQSRLSARYSNLSY